MIEETLSELLAQISKLSKPETPANGMTSQDRLAKIHVLVNEAHIHANVLLNEAKRCNNLFPGLLITVPVQGLPACGFGVNPIVTGEIQNAKEEHSSPPVPPRPQPCLVGKFTPQPETVEQNQLSHCPDCDVFFSDGEKCPVCGKRLSDNG